MSYFSADHFSTDYFSADYFGSGTATPGSIASTLDLIRPIATGNSYWSTNYWSISYWSNNWWNDGYRPPFFAGTFEVSNTFSGRVVSSLSAFSANFDGSTATTVNFDVSVYVGVAWTLSQYDIYTGSTAVTLDDVTAALTGTFVEEDSSVGTIGVTLDGATSNFDGTHVAPANSTGSISVSLDASDAVFRGTFVDPSAIEGDIRSTLTWELSARGTYTSGTFTGSIGETLDDLTADWNGATYALGTQVARVESSLSGVNGNFDGTFVGDTQVVAAVGRRASRSSSAGIRSGRNRIAGGGRKKA